MIKLEICNILSREITEIKLKPEEPLPQELKLPYEGLGLFIDPSTTSMGMSIAKMDKKAPILGIGIKRDSYGTKETFVEEVGVLLNKLFTELDIIIVVAENQYIDKKRYEAYAALKLIMSKIEFVTKMNNIKFNKILPTVWKGVVLDMYPGNVDKRKSNKQEVKYVMANLIPQTIFIKTMDVFDSLGIMYYHLVHVEVSNSNYRKDFPIMVYSIANFQALEDYEQFSKKNLQNILESSKMSELNDLFFNKCNGKIIKINKNSTKEYRKTIYVEINKLRIKDKQDFMDKLISEIEYTTNRIKRNELYYIIPDQNTGISENAMGFIGNNPNCLGLMVLKPNRQILKEMFWGRNILGEIHKDDYIFVRVY